MTTALWPVPTQVLPLGVTTMVPPTREVTSGMPSRSLNGPLGLADRPANTV